MQYTDALCAITFSLMFIRWYKSLGGSCLTESVRPKYSRSRRIISRTNRDDGHQRTRHLTHIVTGRIREVLVLMMGSGEHIVFAS